MADSPAKADGGGERRSSGYRSWKKKYRKMRIVFERKMAQSEELHRHEDKALATVKRLAVENDRLLDLLLEVNNSPQMPPEKRIHLALPPPPADARAPALPLDRRPRLPAARSLEQLLRDVPHVPFRAARDAVPRPAYVGDVLPDGDAPPAPFLSADDVDGYLHAVDAAMDPDARLPTLASRALAPGARALLKNPTSVTNWLRKHAPKIFLQDAEHAADDADADAGHHGRKARASAKADRAAKTAAGDWDASMDDDPDFGATPVPRGKRKRDDDPGYRPGGSTSRLSKKKRKSDGDGTPSVRKTKKESAAAAAAAAAATASTSASKED